MVRRNPVPMQWNKIPFDFNIIKRTKAVVGKAVKSVFPGTAFVCLAAE